MASSSSTLVLLLATFMIASFLVGTLEAGVQHEVMKAGLKHAVHGQLRNHGVPDGKYTENS
jgi:archaellum component FlaG (FlaF/FlaG flagellin family)